MRAAKSSNGALEAAMASLIQNQAAFVALLHRHEQDITEMRRDFEQIKALLLRHEQILMEHSETLRQLPDIIKQKIGSKPQ